MYQLTDFSNTILRLADQAWIPTDPLNRDYQQYLQWLSEGNQPLPAPVIKVIYSCSPWQIRKALNEINKRQTVEEAVAASGDIMIKDGWEFATEFVSNDQFVIAMGQIIGMDEDQVADLINHASTL